MARRPALFCLFACLAALPAGAQDRPAGQPDPVELAIGVFRFALRDPDPDHQARAVRQLALTRDPRVLKALAPVLGHVDDDVASAAARAVAHVGWWLDAAGRGAAVQALTAAVSCDADRRPLVAVAAIDALRDLGDPRAVKPLTKQLGARDYEVSWRAIDTLGALGDPEAVAPLLEAWQRLAHGTRPGDPRGWLVGDWQRQTRVTTTIERLQAALVALTGTRESDPAAFRRWWKTNEPAVCAARVPRERAAEAPALNADARWMHESPSVDRAVARGCQWLIERLGMAADGARFGLGSGPEALALFALVHAGHGGNPRVAEAVTRIAEGELPGGHTAVYECALQCLVLERADGTRWQEAIARRAWWLVHAQASTGAWGYTGPDPRSVPATVPRTQTTGSRFPGVQLAGPGRGKAADATPVIALTRRGWFAPPWTDYSNTQFAVLGLHAAERAHVRCPEDTWTTLEQRLLADQQDGWGYQPGSRGTATPNMTAGGLSSLACAREVLDRPSAARDAARAEAFEALARTPLLRQLQAGNAAQHGRDLTGMQFYYWIWSLERACMLWDQPQVGGRDWYGPIAQVLVDLQRPDGSWGAWAQTGPVRAPRPGPLPQALNWEDPLDTAWAVLFLLRAAPEQRVAPVQITRSALGKKPKPPDDPKPSDD